MEKTQRLVFCIVDPVLLIKHKIDFIRKSSTLSLLTLLQDRQYQGDLVSILQNHLYHRQVQPVAELAETVERAWPSESGQLTQEYPYDILYAAQASCPELLSVSVVTVADHHPPDAGAEREAKAEEADAWRRRRQNSRQGGQGRMEGPPPLQALTAWT